MTRTAGWGGTAAVSTTTTVNTASNWCSSRRSCALPSRRPPRRWRCPRGGPTRRAFLSRLHAEIGRRGTIEVLRNGIKHGALHLDLLYGTPSAGNPPARERFQQNRFTGTRQLRYAIAGTRRSGHFCTHLSGKGAWFLPFNRGWSGGAPNPDGPAIDYLLARGAAAGERDQHPGELRSSGGDEIE